MIFDPLLGIRVRVMVRIMDKNKVKWGIHLVDGMKAMASDVF